MPATMQTLKINLLSKEDAGLTAEARIISWALTYGRYIMIGTEIVVLLAFISRFSLDRKRTDLREEIEQKQAILEADLSFENEIRATQDKLAKIKMLLVNQNVSVDTVKIVASILPPDVYLRSLEVSTEKVHIQAVAGTSEGFSQFLANLLATKQIQNVDISEISKNPAVGITFSLSATIASKATKL